jgi:hypothetical protein
MSCRLVYSRYLFTFFLSLSLTLTLSHTLSLLFSFFVYVLFLSVRLSPFLSIFLSLYQVNLLSLLHDCLVLCLTFQKLVEHSTRIHDSNMTYSECNPAWSGAFCIMLSPYSHSSFCFCLQWRTKIKQLTRETEERNRLLLEEKRSIQRHYQLLKQRIEVYRWVLR